MDKSFSSSTSWLPYMMRTTNYNNWVFGMFKKYVGKRIVDIGSGYGTFINYIKDREYIISVEPSKYCYEHLKKTFSDNKNIRIINGDLNDDTAKELSAKNIDTVICLNVLEHIENDRKTIQNINKCLKPGGKFILYVPALSFIYGTLDESLGHYRRYNKKALEKMIESNGFKIISSRYMNFLGAFSWFVYSKILRKRMPAEKRIIFYDKYLVPILSMIESIVRMPFGQSLLMVCEAIK